MAALHQALVDRLKYTRYIHTPAVEAAFRAVPRHLFLPAVALETVYADEAIPTKRLDGTTVSSSSQPAIMAIMLEQLDLHPGHRVLEIGAGTGYNAALMAHIVGDRGHVVTVDIDDDLVADARERLAAAGFERVHVVCGDGSLGYPAGAPYDRIILTVGAWDIAPAWQEQLKPDGRLVLPLIIRGNVQESVAFEHAGGHLASVSVHACGFMPLRGTSAGPQTTVQLGPDPGLTLTTEGHGMVNARAVYALLTGPSRIWPTTIRVTMDEAWASLGLWLAGHEAHLCTLQAEGDPAERGAIPCLLRHSGGSVCVTSGLLEDGHLCVLTRAADPPASLERSDDAAPFELFVQSFGPEESLAHRLIERVGSWDAAGRPSDDGLRIKVYPRETEYAASTNEVVVLKRWTQLVLDWPDR
ncbi:MAG TPA: methyltransferase, FxLD system [Chloroflexota bacterium]|nr:methyltransferase, FxLD system [Chloroflexota bacterium]